MNRIQRIQPAVDVAHKRQQNAARLVGERQQQLGVRLQRLEELRQYRDEYADQFSHSIQSMSGLYVREYRLFLSRLNQAIEEQHHHVKQARELLSKSQQEWTRCRVHCDAVTKVLERLYAEQRQVQAQREQAQNDEFGQRPHPAKLNING